MSWQEYVSYEPLNVTERPAAALAVTVESDIDRVSALLSGIKGGWQQAVGSALARAANAGKTEAKKAVTEQYALSASEFVNRTKNVNHFNRSSDGEITVSFGYRGPVIPLMRFDTSIDRSGRVVTRVMKTSTKKALDHAFSAKMGSHIGVYERIGTSRFPVKELYGPSTPQMIGTNETVADRVEDKMAEVYEKRIEHEITRILNGWGV